MQLGEHKDAPEGWIPLPAPAILPLFGFFSFPFSAIPVVLGAGITWELFRGGCLSSCLQRLLLFGIQVGHFQGFQLGLLPFPLPVWV